MKDAYLAVVEESCDVYVVECNFAAMVGKQRVAKDVRFEEAVNLKRAWDKLIDDLGLNGGIRQRGYFTTIDQKQVINRL